MMNKKGYGALLGVVIISGIAVLCQWRVVVFNNQHPVQLLPVSQQKPGVQQRLLQPPPLHARRQPRSGEAELNGAMAYPEDVFEDLIHPVVFQRQELPCVPERQEPDRPFLKKTQANVAKDGILMVKVEKSASTTIASVNTRLTMAHTMRQREQRKSSKSQETLLCRHRGMTHTWSTWTVNGRAHLLKGRDQDNSFLWTVMREPTKRHISCFFHFYVASSNISTNDEDYLEVLQSGVDSDFFMGKLLHGRQEYNVNKRLQMSYDPNRQEESYQYIAKWVNFILQNTDFIGLVERLHESLTMLQLLLGIPTRDIVYSTSKIHGNYVTSNTGKCIQIPRSFVSPAVQAYYDSITWKVEHLADLVLYAALDRSMDMTIQALGPERFQKALDEFNHCQQLVNDQCAHTAIFPCNSNGQKADLSQQNCYGDDVGCGYKCMDQVFAKNTTLCSKTFWERD